MMGTTASQVRQDFNCFGGFGQQGIGYHVDVLLEADGPPAVQRNESWTPFSSAPGRLGTAISSYLTAEAKGYRLIGAFDKNAEVIGRELCGVPVRDVQELDKLLQKASLCRGCAVHPARERQRACAYAGFAGHQGLLEFQPL